MRQCGGDLDLAKKSLRAHGARQLRPEDLDGDLAAVLEISGEEDVCHSTAADLPLYGVAVSKRGTQLFNHRMI